MVQRSIFLQWSFLQVHWSIYSSPVGGLLASIGSFTLVHCSHCPGSAVSPLTSDCRLCIHHQSNLGLVYTLHQHLGVYEGQRRSWPAGTITDLVDDTPEGFPSSLTLYAQPKITPFNIFNTDLYRILWWNSMIPSPVFLLLLSTHRIFSYKEISTLNKAVLSTKSVPQQVRFQCLPSPWIDPGFLIC